jgi:hypothetical protein
MSIEAMKQALDALEKHGTHYARHEDDYIKAITALREAIEFEEMVKKGTKAWADTPDGWVDDLRGGVEKIVPSDYTNSHQPVAKDRHEFVDWQGVAADQAMTIAMLKLESKREWVGFTHEELGWLNEALNLGGRFAVIEAIEAKLKERNT